MHTDEGPTLDQPGLTNLAVPASCTVAVHGEKECVTLNKPNTNPGPRDSPAADLKVVISISR